MNSRLDISDITARRRERKRLVFIATVLGVTYILFVGAVWVFARSGIFDVRHIKFEGAGRIPQGEVLSVVYAAFDKSFISRVLGPGNILDWPSSVSSQYAMFIPEARTISIEKDFRSGTVTIHVQERMPEGIWCLEPSLHVSIDNSASDPLLHDSTGADVQAQSATTAGSHLDCYWFGDDGVLWRRAAEAQGGVLKVIHDYSGRKLGINDAALPDAFIPNLFSVMNVLGESGLSIKEIRFKDVGLEEVEAQTYLGPVIYFSLREPADKYLRILESFASRPEFKYMQYIDFRSDNRAYYK